ncbi:anti-sigma factor [Nocardioides insulae]|uniref:anti-sigma factor n=1 Tax=Nocardioides insulae TaxID=394734 RepID=UPI00041BE933|nr:anti-sigma factor [Nocardioides insulae]
MTDQEFYDGGDVHTLSGAYAVDAVDDTERARFEEHLRGCAECRAEVAELRETAARLSTDLVEPPAALRGRVLEGIESIRPLPPLPPEQSPEQPTEARSEEVGDELATRRRRRMPLLLAAAASVVLIAAVALTAWLGPWSQEDPEPITATERVLTADDATRSTLEFEDGSSATVVMSPSVDRAAITTDDMAPAPEGQVYQLWYEDPSGGMESAGLMPDDSDATVLLDGEVGDHTGVGITVEPDGGSPAPTSDPIALFAFDG